ncbi:ankyrin repeat-containing domain protein, partial [Gamsiella multidivaricata]|uniref:ankyrin repeat-containing domain protein n=1 Tax=Gamsiella multidivaricata TaxID=101098 RepID=UPI00221EAA95
LVAARSRNPIETMKVLIQHGAALDRGDHNGTTVLHFICEQYSNPVEAIQFLTRAGADCNSRDAKKRTPTPLHYAIMHSKEPAPVMELLLKKNSDVNARDWRKSTPLHLVLEKMDNEEIVQMLL